MAQDISTTNNQGAAIHIQADNVVIDLGDKTIRGFDQGTAIIVDGNFTNIVVKNGTLLYFNNGVSAASATSVTVENVKVYQNTGSGIKAGGKALVIRNYFEGGGAATSPAVQVGPGSTIINTTVANWATATGGVCFVLGDNSSADKCTAANGYIGFKLGKNDTCNGCNAYSNVDTGFYCDIGDIIRQCTSHDNLGDCYFLGDGNTLQDSEAMNCGKSCVNVAGNSYSMVVGNKFDQCNNLNDPMGAGIAVHSSNNWIDGNWVTRWKQFGINIFSPSTNNSVTRNFTFGGIAFGIQAWNFPTNDIAPRGTSSAISQPLANVVRP